MIQTFSSLMMSDLSMVLPSWVLVLPSLVWMFSMLGFRPVESLDQLSGFSRYAAAYAILVHSLTAVTTEPELVILNFIVAFVVGGVCLIGTWDWFRWTVRRIWDFWMWWKQCEAMWENGKLYGNAPLGVLWAVGHLALSVSFQLPIGEWALNVHTFPLFVNLRLVWWAFRSVLALVWMAIVAACRAIMAGATGAAKSKGMVSAERVRNLSSVVALVPVACNEATVLLRPETVEAAPALEIEANAPVVSVVPEKARTKPKVPKGVVRPKPSRRVLPTPKAQIVCPPRRRSERIAKRSAERMA
jgi:hypothetical protein